MEVMPSIFNDVLSPVTPGPSSSNTCGPYRIGSIGRALLGETPKKLAIRMAAKGGYSDTFYSMQSDLAFIAAFLGKEFLAYDLTKAYEDAGAYGMETEFTFVDDFPLKPSELAEITVTGTSCTLSMMGVSLGGGAIEITEINGQKVRIDGKKTTAVCFWEDGSIQVVTEEEAIGNAWIMESTVEGLRVVTLEPIYPFGVEERAVPFTNAEELWRYAEKKKIPLWRAAFDYEMAVTGATEEELRQYAKNVKEICLRAMEKGCDENNHFTGVTNAKAKQYQTLLQEGKLISLGASDRACLDAMSIMEYSNAHGTIVCMPTGGSSGIIPAAIYDVGKELGATEEAMENALMVAGLIGVFYYPTHYTGAIGCQAEIGVAISMAAAALTSFKTDDVRIIEAAASLGGQSVMGLLCNPIEGYVQVPCILRNMAAVPIAVTCANSALAQMDHIVPLDEVVQLMLAVGEKIRPCDQAGTYCLKCHGG